MEKIFEYSGLHFEPAGSMKQTYATLLNNLKPSRELGMHVFAGAKRFYTYETFRNTADYVSKTANIFKCIENGKYYVPFTNELMEYAGKN